jgi:AcrR family transcriptional regulator
VTAEEIQARPKRRRAATVERLLDAALETFAEIGFAAASVEDICSRGGFTRGAFYSSFRTKDELFGALFARETARNLTRAEEQLAGIEAEADPVTAAVERCLSTFRADRTWVLVQTEYRLHAARHPEAAAALREHSAGLHARLTELIDLATVRAGLRLTVPAGQLARIVLALHDGVVVHSVVPQAVVPQAVVPQAVVPHAVVPQEPVTGEGNEAPDLERTALLLLLRSAVTNSAVTS